MNRDQQTRTGAPPNWPEVRNVVSALGERPGEGGERMKTNFEKWRDSLTPEWVAEFMEGHHILRGCHECPAEWYHRHGTAKGRNGCFEVFLEWANAPAKEEE